MIRARLRALLAEGSATGWLPDDDEDDEHDRWEPAARADPVTDRSAARRPGPGIDPEHVTVPVGSGASGPVTPVPEQGAPAGLGRHRAAGPTPRLDPGRRGALALAAAAVVAALAVTGWSWATRPAVDQVTASAVSDGTSATTAPASDPVDPVDPAPGVGTGAGTSAATTGAGVVVVAVVGQVVSPGVVTLPAGSRVADALAAVGGLLPGTDPATVNAAALLSDGQQIAVGVPGAPGAATPGAPGPPAGAGTGGAAGGRVDLNTATAADLDALPGIGPVLAQRIVEHRDQHGPFARVEQLDDVSGIGPTTYAELADLVTV